MTSLAYAALWFFIFAVPWQNMILIPGVGTISRLMGMVAIGFAVLACVMHGHVRRWRFFHLAALLFVLWSGWSLYRAGVFRQIDQEMMVAKFLTYVQLFLVLWMVWELARTPRRQLGLMLAYVLGAGVASLNTIMVYRTQSATLRRFAAAGFDPNDLAMMLVLALPMAWYLGLTHQRWLVRWLCRGYLLVGLTAIALTGSRGGLLASIVALLVVPLTMTRLTPGRLLAGIAVVGAAGAFAVAYIPKTVADRLSSTRQEVEVGDLNGRLLIWKAGARALIERPLMGHGTGGFNRAVRPTLGYGRAAHNTYLGVLVEQGIFGFLLWAALFVAVFVRALRLPLLERRFTLVLLATVLVAMLPLTWDDNKAVWIVMAVLIALSESFMPQRPAAAVVAGPLPTGPHTDVRQPAVTRRQRPPRDLPA
jgi:O-antigen ligase